MQHIAQVLPMSPSHTGTGHTTLPIQPGLPWIELLLLPVELTAPVASSLTKLYLAQQSSTPAQQPHDLHNSLQPHIGASVSSPDSYPTVGLVQTAQNSSHSGAQCTPTWHLQARQPKHTQHCGDCRQHTL